jgi:hypothetical protein
MYVEVKIHAQPKTPLFRVPERAVRPGNQIWVARPREPGPRSKTPEAKPRGTHQLHVVDVDVVEVDEGGGVVRGNSEYLHVGAKVVASPLGVQASGTESDDPIRDAVEKMEVDLNDKQAVKDE